MATTKKHILFLIALAAVFCTCDYNSFPFGPEESSRTIDTIDCSKWDIPAGAITVHKALAVGRALGSGAVSEEEYLIKGVVSGFGSKHESSVTDQCYALVYIKDNLKTTASFYGYRITGIDGEPILNLDQIKVGDFIVIKGKITNYNGTIETSGSACLAFSTNQTAYDKESQPDTVDTSVFTDFPEGAITVYQARKIGRALGSGQATDKEYLIKGIVSKLDDKHESAITDYGNAVFYLKDNLSVSPNFYAYQIMGIDGIKFANLNQVQVGDFVVVKGKITNYSGTIETESKGAAHLAFSSNALAYPQEGDTIDTSDFPNFPEGTITVATACKIGKALGSGGTSDQEYLIKGRVKGFNSKHTDAVKQYGNAYVYIHDSENSTYDFYGYQVMGLRGNKLTSIDQIKVGDFIVIKGKITNYNGTIETTGRGAAQIVYSTNDLMYPLVDKTYFEESFAEGKLGKWAEQVKSGSVQSVWGTYSTSGVTGAVANSNSQSSESWLVSPEINVGVTHAHPVRLTFNHYYKAPTASRQYVQDYLRVKVRDNDGDWHDMEIQNFNTGARATYKADTLDITPYADGVIQVAFAYKCDATFVPTTWNITNITLVEHKREDR